MKCDQCKGETTIERRRHHYTECGLDNVYLDNIEVRVCPACGHYSPRIPRINDLHAVIGQAVALQNVQLSGKEVRFLRQHLGLKAKEWANYLRVDTSTLSRWESGEQTIGMQSEALIRLLYFHLLAEREGRPLPERVAEQIAAVVWTRANAPAVLVNPQKPVRYSYHTPAELAAA
jgi:putative zinc finger/helix-turn-helix YgiT family protein